MPFILLFSQYGMAVIFKCIQHCVLTLRKGLFLVCNLPVENHSNGLLFLYTVCNIYSILLHTQQNLVPVCSMVCCSMQRFCLTSLNPMWNLHGVNFRRHVEFLIESISIEITGFHWTTVIMTAPFLFLCT